MTVDVAILGLGVAAVPDQVTVETERILRSVNEILFVDGGVGTRTWLETLGPKVTDLFTGTYHSTESRFSAYDHMAARTVEAALDHGPVAFAMQGHALVYAYAPFLIRDLGEALGLTVRVWPGISSMACLFADLFFDPSVDGLQMYEATDLLLRARPLQPDVPLLVWQIGNLETRLHTRRPSRPERFDRFKAHLLRYYPPDHPIVAYFAPPFPLMEPTIRWFPLKDVGEHAEALHAGITLYVPPVGRRTIQDLELLALADDPEHLARITR